MPRKSQTFEAGLEKLPDYKIYINIQHLKKGHYQLNIINRNKLIKRTTFKKP